MAIDESASITRMYLSLFWSWVNNSQISARIRQTDMNKNKLARVCARGFRSNAQIGVIHTSAIVVSV